MPANPSEKKEQRRLPRKRRKNSSGIRSKTACDLFLIPAALFVSTRKEGPDEPVGFAYSFLVHRRGISLRTNRLSGGQDSGHPTQFFQPGEILVEKGKIRAIGKSVKVPKKAKVVEWKDLEIYAGLISPGSSLGLTEINALRPTRDEREVGTHTPDGKLGSR